MDQEVIKPDAHRKFYPGLQGLRGVAAGLVFISHYAALFLPLTIWHWGTIGVDFFFVLSGFLITGILRAARTRPDYFRRFYRNRAYRIFPVFYGLWLAILLLSPWLRPVWTWRMLSMPVYLGNFFELGHVANSGLLHLGVGHGRSFIMLAHLWTLTVEEHFYLLWPLVVLLVGRLKWLRVVAATGVVLTLLLRCYLVLHLPQYILDYERIYYSTYTRLDSILMGALLSLWMEGGGATVEVRRRMARWLTAVPVALLLAGQLFLPDWPRTAAYNWRFETYGMTLIAILGCGLLLGALDEESLLYRVLTLKPLMSFGLISYSFYMLHLLPYNLLEGYAHKVRPGSFQSLLLLLLIFVVSYVVSVFSYRFVELPFLRMKDRRNHAARQQRASVAS